MVDPRLEGVLVTEVSRQRYVLDVFLGFCEVLDLFERIVGADMVALPKPDPEMLQVTLEHTLFDSTTDRAFMVGDNSKDMEAGFRAGATSVFATWGFSPEGHGDHVIGHPREFLELI